MSDLALIRAWCEQARPIFICGLARSGTSMLQVAFARHTEMFNIKNCRETFVFLRPRQGMTDPVHVPTKLYLRGREGLVGFRKQVRALQKTEGEMSDADVIRTFFWYAGNVTYPGRQPLEKTPGHLRKLPLIFKLFPNARIIVCSRDPVDVAASYRKRLNKDIADGKPGAADSWLNKSPQQMMEVFQKFNALVDEARPKYGKQMFIAPYEWLVEDPGGALQQLCDFAGMRFEPAMLTRTDDEVVDDSDGEDAAEYLSRKTSSSKTGITKRESDAQTVLSPEDIAYLTEGSRDWVEFWRTPAVLV